MLYAHTQKKPFEILLLLCTYFSLKHHSKTVQICAILHTYTMRYLKFHPTNLKQLQTLLLVDCFPFINVGGTLNVCVHSM